MRASHGRIFPAAAGRTAPDLQPCADGSGGFCAERGGSSSWRWVGRCLAGRPHRAVRGPSRSRVRAARDPACHAGYAAGTRLDGAARSADRAGGFLLSGGDVSARRNWIAARGEAFVLAALALVLLGISSHAAAISESLWPRAIDMAHLLGAGIWVGGLPPLALLLYAASRDRPRPIPTRCGPCSAFPASRS